MAPPMSASGSRSARLACFSSCASAWSDGFLRPVTGSRASRMRKALALRHVAFEDLDRLEDILAACGYQSEIIDVPLTDLSRLDGLGPDLLIVLGGPIGVYETDA